MTPTPTDNLMRAVDEVTRKLKATEAEASHYKEALKQIARQEGKAAHDPAAVAFMALEKYVR